MYKILKARLLAENIYEMQIKAPWVANKCLPGQLVILRVDEIGERIPLTISDYENLTTMLKYPTFLLINITRLFTWKSPYFYNSLTASSFAIGCRRTTQPQKNVG